MTFSLAALWGTAWPFWMDSALKGAALLVLAGVAVLALSRASAATRHFVWLFAAAALLLLPMLSALLPGWSVLPRWTAVQASPRLSITAEPATPALPSAVAGPAEASSEAAFARPRDEQAKPLSLRDWLPFVWAAGFALCVLRLFVGYWLLLKAARRCQVITEGPLAEAMEAARRQLNLRQAVPVLLDSRRIIPMVWGLFRPRVLLPAEAAGWGEARLRSVFLHELAHVKRWDLAAQWLMQAACALHWFNPLVWFAAWRLHVEGERACDNLVLASGVRASEYAEHVLHIATQLTPPCNTGAAGVAMARPSLLEGRLLAVLNERLNRRGLTRALMFVALALGLGVIIPVAMLRAADEKKLDRPAGAPPVAERKRNAVAPPVTEAVTVEMAQDGSFIFEGRTVTWDVLTNELQMLRQTNPKLKAVIRLAPEAAFSNVATLFDALKQAVSSISLATRMGDPTEPLVPLRDAEREPDRPSDLQLRRANVERRQADVARVRLRQAEAELKRLMHLRAENLISGAELDEARLKVERLKVETESDPAQRTRAELNLAKAELAFAQANFKRMEELTKQKLSSEAERERAEAEAAAAEARLRLVAAQYEQSVFAQREIRAGASSSRQKKDRLLQLLAEEIQVAEDQAKIAHEQHQAGTATLETRLRAELDVLSLKREKASLNGDTAQARHLIGQQISVLQDLERSARELRQRGVASEADELKVRRQILLLQRQQAELE